MTFMADINIENFYRHIARILSILYTNFPTKAAIYVDEVAGVDEPDEYGLHSPTYTAGFYTLLWLEEEGYMRYADVIRQDGVDQASLTKKAFLRLTEVANPIYSEPSIEVQESNNIISLQPMEEPSPSILEERMLVINQLRTALRNGSSIAITKIVHHVLRNC
ncbi:MAG: hypothetical protein ABGY96_05090 [bacterium]|nr:hypothetical protein [Gammaproteobacteria bacterium]HIL96046.1 hypothetical protein [Pseudomonadales bacterium]